MVRLSVFLSLLLATAIAAQAAEGPPAPPAAKLEATIPAPRQVAPPPDPVKGKEIVLQVCVTCHSADGNSTIEENPKLAGQHPEYLAKQLKNFRATNGKRAERTNPIMNGIAAALSDADIKNVAAYFSSQTLKGEKAKNPETAEAGRNLYRAGNAQSGIPACAACHGPAGAGVPALFPRIGGQFAEYIEGELKAFRSKRIRTNDPNGMMRAVTARMTDAEIKAVSDYVAGLR